MSDRPDTSTVDSEYDPERVVVRDKRRIDPTTGAAREAAATPPSAGEPAAPVEDAVPAGDDRVTELTGDLQRLSAEYANYRKRVQRDQATLLEMTTADLVSRLLPLLDDVDRAREHGDLDGAFKVVGEGLEGIVAKLGVERFGAAGDAFDPQVHEAVMSAPEDPSVSVATCVQVFAPGYRNGSGRLLRPAKVVVAEPAAVAGETVAEVVDGPTEAPPAAEA